MAKPIDDINFWKKRIETAVKPHYSVYVVHEPGWKAILDAHTEIIRKVIPEGASVLDAGCAFARMSELFSDEQYTGVDFSPDFIEQGKKKYPNKNLLVGNLKELSFPDKSFDWAFCVSIKKMVIDNLGQEEWDKMEKELKRVAHKVLIMEYEDPLPFSII